MKRSKFFSLLAASALALLVPSNAKRREEIFDEEGELHELLPTEPPCPTCNGTRYVRLTKTFTLWLCPDCCAGFNMTSGLSLTARPWKG